MKRSGTSPYFTVSARKSSCLQSFWEGKWKRRGNLGKNKKKKNKEVLVIDSIIQVAPATSSYLCLWALNIK